MKTAFDRKNGRWAFDAAARLPRHDLFFGSPVNDPAAGLPLGDGDTGSLLWFEKDGLHLHLNKCDLWEDAPADAVRDPEIFCSAREEALTALRHGGELTLRFDSPLFEACYQRRFEARLSLADACARITSETPFGTLRAEAFADAGSHVGVLHVRVSAAEPCAPRVRLARFGSRNMWRWYAIQKFAPETGLGGTDADARDDLLFISQELDPTKFCIGVRIDGEIGRSRALNRHACEASLAERTEHAFTIYYTIVCAEDTARAKELCARRLADAARAGRAALFEAHRAAWADFWRRSFVRYPDDYVENVYYLYLYYMNSQSRGAYPPHFTRGLWGVYHDYLPWTYYFHYNMQHMYMPLDAAGCGDLAANYYAMRRRGLDVARLYAAREKKLPGAFYHDVADRYGRFATYDSLNCTPGAQIAMQMYRSWRYSGDAAFLNDAALPVMRAVAEFYLAFLQKGEDGLYHIRGTTAYEGNRPTDDTLTDLVMIRALFSAYLPFADAETGARLSGVLRALPEPITVPLAEEDLDGGTLARGIGAGRAPRGDGRVFAAGLRDGAPARIMKKEPEYGFPDIELCPLYPAGIFGLKDRGTPLFDVMTNQILLGSGTEMEWSMYPVYLARMGMADELLSMQRGLLSRWQAFPNGFNAEANEPPLPGTVLRYTAKETQTGKPFRVEARPFAHFDFETEPIIAESVQQALLQSHEGVIRVFPAVREGLEAAFSLYAEGGFRVGAETTAGGFALTVDNLRGEPFLLALPDRIEPASLFLYRGRGADLAPAEIRTAQTGFETALDLRDSVRGERILLCSAAADGLVFAPPEPAAPNADMKECGAAVLGSPRLPETDG